MVERAEAGVLHPQRDGNDKPAPRAMPRAKKLAPCAYSPIPTVRRWKPICFPTAVTTLPEVKVKLYPVKWFVSSVPESLKRVMRQVPEEAVLATLLAVIELSELELLSFLQELNPPIIIKEKTRSFFIFF
jgi:hypothetical protein